MPPLPLVGNQPSCTAKICISIKPNQNSGTLSAVIADTMPRRSQMELRFVAETTPTMSPITIAHTILASVKIKV
ncbi:UNVERIFIED_CONTAM: hypothetical protein ABID98_005961 [Brevibacillus sp. OAP136]